MKKISFGNITLNVNDKDHKDDVSCSSDENDAFGKIEIQSLDINESTTNELQDLIGIQQFGKKKDNKQNVFKKPQSVKDNNIDDFDNSSNDSDGYIGPPIPEQLKKSMSVTENVDNNESENDSSDDEDEKYEIPCNQEIEMVHGNKAVLCICADSSGSRLVSGSIDFDVCFWYFAGMNASMKSFRTIKPCENHSIKHLDYANSGDLVLVISGSSQIRIVDKEGFVKFESVKGDQYINDMAKTKGHTAVLNCGSWNPINIHECISCSKDGTCRLWDFMSKHNQQKSLLKIRTQSGLKSNPTACKYNHTGSTITIGSEDGSIQIWDTKKSLLHPVMKLRDAHEKNHTITSLAHSYLGNDLLSRSFDGTMKLWDLRNFKKPLFIADQLYSKYETVNCSFSPNDEIIITGCSKDSKHEESSVLKCYRKSTFDLIGEIAINDSQIIQTLWHPKLNQIFLTTSTGVIKAFYDEKRSLMGAKMCVTRVEKRSKLNYVTNLDQIKASQVITPHALPLFRTDRPKSVKKQLEKDRLNPVKSKRPDLPITTGRGGRLAASGTTLSSYVIRNLGLSKRVEDDQDPREAILKYAKDAAENPYWISPAYQVNQPKVILDGYDDEASQLQSKNKKLKSDNDGNT